MRERNANCEDKIKDIISHDLYSLNTSIFNEWLQDKKVKLVNLMDPEKYNWFVNLVSGYIALFQTVFIASLLTHLIKRWSSI